VSDTDNSGVAAALMINEIRDLRGTMDRHDERLRAEIRTEVGSVKSEVGSLKDSVSELSATVIQSQNEVGKVKADVDKLQECQDELKHEIGVVRSSVTNIETQRKVEKGAWDGPIRTARNTAFIVAGITALITAANWFNFISLGIPG